MVLKNIMSVAENSSYSIEELGRGMYLCFCNAKNLIEDAELLLKKRPERAISLSILAMEEMGKIFFLCNLAGASTGDKIKGSSIRGKNGFMSHKRKQIAFSTYGTLINKVNSTAGVKKRVKYTPFEYTPLLDYFKQWGLYVECGIAKFQSPMEFAQGNPNLAKQITKAAKSKLNCISVLHKTEDDSIRLARMAKILANKLAKAKTSEEIRMALREVIKSKDEFKSTLRESARSKSKEYTFSVKMCGVLKKGK